MVKKKFNTPPILRWIFFRRIWGFSSKSVYLTFDDGPTPELTEWILDVLRKHDVKATFFCVGSNVEKQPELFARILQEGHVVGNHTMCHEKGTEVSEAIYLESIQQAGELIASDLFRPPYGRVPMTYTRQIRKNYRIIMWSWLSYDYDPTVSTDSILQSARKDIKGGDILVLHDNKKVIDRLEHILPELLQIVKAKGLDFATISS